MAGNLPGQRRKLVVVACYLPPNDPRTRVEGALDFITGVVVDVKRRF